MAIDLTGGLSTLITAGLKIIDKVIPDPVAKAAAQQKLLELKQSGELAELNANLQLALGQVEINKIEAASESTWKSGWRPGIGWMCMAGLAYQYLFRTIVVWVVEVIAWAFKADLSAFPKPPELDTSTLIALVTSLIGLGTMRMTEKLNDKA